MKNDRNICVMMLIDVNTYHRKIENGDIIDVNKIQEPQVATGPWGYLLGCSERYALDFATPLNHYQKVPNLMEIPLDTHITDILQVFIANSFLHVNHSSLIFRSYLKLPHNYVPQFHWINSCYQGYQGVAFSHSNEVDYSQL